MSYQNYKQDISERAIFLEQYKEILKSTAKEMRGGYENSIYSGNNILKEYVPDTRSVFYEGVNGFARGLYPFFDEKMRTYYKSHKDKYDSLYKKYADKEGFISGQGNQTCFSIKSFQLYMDLFQELSCLLHRLGYLKGTAYTEDEEEDEEE